MPDTNIINSVLELKNRYGKAQTEYDFLNNEFENHKASEFSHSNITASKIKVDDLNGITDEVTELFQQVSNMKPLSASINIDVNSEITPITLTNEGSEGYSFKVIKGELAEGLSLNNNTISGTPTKKETSKECKIVVRKGNSGYIFTLNQNIVVPDVTTLEELFTYGLGTNLIVDSNSPNETYKLVHIGNYSELLNKDAVNNEANNNSWCIDKATIENSISAVPTKFGILMSNKVLGYSSIKNASNDKYVYSESVINEYLNNYFSSKFSNFAEVNHIAEISTRTIKFGSPYDSLTIQKLFIPSRTELFGSNEYDGYPEGKHFDYFKNNTNALYLERKNLGDKNKSYWLRTPSSSYDSFARVITTNGDLHYSSIIDEGIGVVPCFIVVF